MTEEDIAWKTIRDRHESGGLIPGRDTDRLVAIAMGWRTERQSQGRLVYRKGSRGYWQTMPCWSSSMEDAVRLYDPRPDMIPSDPIRCCMDALTRRWQRDRPTLRTDR